ncbi:MAG: hypothetical protein HY820_10815 [Acidobacteria bacterium]|nr:hypothetical protein [Acidobacteriota bacterium]
MRLPTAIATLAVLVIAILGLRSTQTQAYQVTNPQPTAPEKELQAVTLVLGSKDPKPADWSGSVSLSKGDIVRLAGFHFTDEHSVSGNSWKCGTYEWGAFSGGMHPNEKGQPQPTPMQPCGVTILFRAPGDAVFTVKLPKGEFTFRPVDVPEGEGIYPLGATIEVTRSATSELATTSANQDDFPALSADGDRMWLSWVAYKEKADRVFLRSQLNGVWTEPAEITEKPGDVFMTAVGVAGGKPMVVWSEREAKGFQLKARTPGGPVMKVTDIGGNHIFHRVASDAKGNLHLVWQSFRNTRSDIYMKTLSNGVWSGEINLSDARRDARANDWNPAVATDKDGTVWVAWDSYATGSYNIFLRPIRNGQPGPIQQVTNSPRFHAHPTLTVDAQNRLWIAWDESRENWGKDTGFLINGGTGLYDSRKIMIAVLDKGKWLAPLQQVEDIMPYGFRRFAQTARLVSDAKGRMWMFLRPRSNTKLPTTLWAAGGKWETYATYYNGDHWSELIIVPESTGRNEGEVAVAADRQGNVFAAVATDGRLYGGPNFSNAPREHDVYLARLNSVNKRVAADLAPRGTEGPAGKPNEPREREQIRALRSHVIAAGGSNYKLYRGDMHRHTEISLDGAGDGTLFDSYRYALDASGMDWLAVTDHQSGQVNATMTDYQWWRSQKATDMFHAPGFFTALYGTERSLGYPNGHRNLIYAKRGVPILHIRPGEAMGGAENTGPILYPFLRKYGGIATSHTSHTNMGTDWRDNDPELEPIVEIYQGARTSAEREGAPLSPTAKRTELWAGGYRPLGFVSNAWAKGYKLGVQASSDHVSTHTSYAFLLSENSSREALLDAMRQRHTYAATSNILMDYRMNLGGKTYIQGDIAASQAMPEITAKIIGSAALKQVVVIRDNEVIYSQDPNKEIYDLRFRESSTLAAGEHFYYVRAEQVDGNVAWSSPIWVKR